jgi:hypothetical protein
MDKILLFYLHKQYEYSLLIFQDYEEYEIVNVRKMYLYDEEIVCFFLKRKIDFISKNYK